LRLPVTQSDKVSLLGREVPIVSAMMPISREMYRAFDSQRSGFDKKIDLHLVVDVSDSTRDFLESAMGGVARTLTSTNFRDRVNVNGVHFGRKGRVLGGTTARGFRMVKQRPLGRRRFSGLLQLGYVGYQGAHSLPQERSARAAAGKCCLNGAAARNLYRV
jgi:hypothetical protein